MAQSKELDDLLEHTGYGTFHLFLLIICGCILSSDSIEVTSVSFVTPVLNNSTDLNLQPTKFQTGVLDSIIFVGMMIGGFFWGVMADIIGRKWCLISTVTINGVFGLSSSLSPNFTAFLVFRFFSGIGVGGSAPIVFSYFSEFYSTSYQSIFIMALATFWSLGTIYTSFLAWIVIPWYVSFYIGALEVTSWRIFLALCTIPCFLAAIILLCLPESPGFLFSKRKMDKLQKYLYKIENCQCRLIGKRNVDHSTEVLKSANCSPVKEPENKLRKKINLVCSTTIELFKPPQLRPTILLTIAIFCLAFGSYGLVMWFPEYFKYIQTISCLEKYNETQQDDNNCSLSSHDYSKIYLHSLFYSLSNIPGIIFGLLFIRVLGSKVILALASFVSALTSFAIWIVPKTSTYLTILSCLFTCFSTMCWNCVDVIIPESFPIHLRTTSFGMLSAISRIGSIVGLLLFGKMITISPFIPILIVASLFTLGGLSVIFVPRKSHPPLCQYLIYKFNKSDYKRLN